MLQMLLTFFIGKGGMKTAQTISQLQTLYHLVIQLDDTNDHNSKIYDSVSHLRG